MLFPNLGISLSRSEGLFPLPLKLCRSLQLHWWYGFYPSLRLRTHTLGTQPLYFREASATQRGHERVFHLIAPAEVPPHSHHYLPDRWGTFLSNDSCAQRLSTPADANRAGMSYPCWVSPILAVCCHYFKTKCWDGLLCGRWSEHHLILIS